MAYKVIISPRAQIEISEAIEYDEERKVVKVLSCFHSSRNPSDRP